MDGQPGGRWHAIECIRGLVPDDDRALIHQGETWVHFSPRGAGELPAHGWKLHISARAASIRRVADTVLPRIIAAQTPFKVVRSQVALALMNEGTRSPASVGKAITVYPSPTIFVQLATELAELLAGQPAPRILSDRQVRPDSPVYYRYGPFRQEWRTGRNGGPEIALVGPSGQVTDGLAGLNYVQPDWVEDPFGRPKEELRGTILGGRYRVTEGFQQAVRGDVYSAVDETTGQRVVVKQARAFVSEALDSGIDMRSRLRNERRILDALRGCEGVPRFIDHFAHGSDEYLVISHMPGATLLDTVLLQGRFRAALGSRVPDAVWDDFLALAVSLRETLARIHRAGVVLRDISPRNVIIDGSSGSYIDFGISMHEDFWLPGGTPGFCPPHQLREGARPAASDDVQALTRSLFFAITTMMPTPGVTDDEWSAHGYLEQVTVSGCITSGQRSDLLEALGCASPPASPASNPAPVDVGRARRRLLSRLVERVEARLASRDVDIFRVDTSIYTGMAGVGRELLHHGPQDESIARLVGQIAGRCARVVDSLAIPPGFLIGSTGVEIFLSQARAHGIDAPRFAAEGEVQTAGSRASWAPAHSVDLMQGKAGVALGYLELARLGSARHLDAAVDLIAEILAEPDHRSPPVQDDLPPQAGVDKQLGAAHGLSGLVECLSCAVLLGADQFRAPLDALMAECERRMVSVHRHASSRTGLPISASWCQGLAGLARAFVGAGVALGADSLIERGREFLATALEWIPRLDNLSACCGVSGVSSIAMDVAAMLGPRQAADTDLAPTLEALRLRSTRREELEHFHLSQGDAPLSVGLGFSGVLHLLRRIELGGPGFIPSPLVPLAHSEPLLLDATLAGGMSSSVQSALSWPIRPRAVRRGPLAGE